MLKHLKDCLQLYIIALHYRPSLDGLTSSYILSQNASKRMIDYFELSRPRRFLRPFTTGTAPPSSL